MLERSHEDRVRRRRAGAQHLHDPQLPEVFTRQDARAFGMSDRQIDRRVASQAWIQLRRGVYSVRTNDQPREGARLGVRWDDDSADVAGARAALLIHDQRDLALSHGSAALLHGLARPIGGWPRPTATTATGPTRLRADVHLLVAPLHEREVIMVNALPVTSLARTVADCLRSMSPFDGLAIADSAARQGLSGLQLQEALDHQAGWPGVRRGRELATLMEARRETPLESWSAWSFHRWEVPRPQWQVEIFDETGFFCGRVDSWWPEGLAGEADGRAKYTLAAAERGEADAAGLSDVLDRERQREQAIRRAGAEIVRWGSQDLFHERLMENLARHLQRQLRLRAHPGIHFAGVARPGPADTH